MRERLILPVGIEDFREIRNGQFYYVDKTKLIEQLLEQWGKVNLFIRPRRFGKTLNMSMLRAFFEIGTDKSLFDGLDIAKNERLCDEYMGRFPVIFISLKGAEGATFREAALSLAELVRDEVRRHSFLLEEDRLSTEDKSIYRELLSINEISDTEAAVKLKFSLKKLAELLYKHYGQRVIILIDEYDVPLDKAFQNGYYREMVSLIRGLLGEALKTNEYLQFAVLTGCLRVSKESIFTGLNNFRVLSITDTAFDEQFGFTQDEVRMLLAAYGLESHMTEIREWYDGYRFGDADIYCPWDVINHVGTLCSAPEAQPRTYWINSSGNDLVKRFIDKADKTTRNEIERLLAGEAIDKEIRLELTYDEIDNSIDNLWSVLFTTGYLTQVGTSKNGIYKLRIPNKEIREVYRTQIRDWFAKTVQDDKEGLRPLWQAFSEGNAQEVEEILTKIMGRTISVLDPKGSETEKEKFYHAFLTGVLVGNGTWGILSNKESGEGFADLLVEMENPDMGLVIELKVADKVTELDGACKRAIAQIHDRRYDEYLRNEGRNDIWAYGIAFYKKRCRVAAQKLENSFRTAKN